MGPLTYPLCLESVPLFFSFLLYPTIYSRKLILNLSQTILLHLVIFLGTIIIFWNCLYYYTYHFIFIGTLSCSPLNWISWGQKLLYINLHGYTHFMWQRLINICWLNEHQGQSGIVLWLLVASIIKIIETEFWNGLWEVIFFRYPCP